jgi:hypothetical protein
VDFISGSLLRPKSGRTPADRPYVGVCVCVVFVCVCLCVCVCVCDVLLVVLLCLFWLGWVL